MFPRTGVVTAGRSSPTWAPADDVVLERAPANGSEDLDDLAARGALFAEQLIVQRVGGGLIVAEHVLEIDGQPLTVAGARRTADLGRRLKGARTVTWEPQADGSAVVTIESANGDRLRSTLAADEAAALREKAGR